MTRRTNHVLREFIDIVEAQILRNGMCLERAAELLLEHGTPPHVTVRIITRVQQAMPLPALAA